MDDQASLSGPRFLAGVIYYDGRFDDSRPAVNLAQTVFDLGRVAVNRCPVEGLVKENGLLSGVHARDLESGVTFELKAKGVINATGVFTDRVRHMDDATAPGVIAARQGVHRILPRRFLPGDVAIMVPHTSDGRILFEKLGRDADWAAESAEAYVQLARGYLIQGNMEV